MEQKNCAVVFAFCIAILSAAGCSGGSDVIGYSGKDIHTAVSLVRNAKTKKAALAVTINEPWELFMGASPQTIDLSAPFASGERAGAFLLDLPAETRAYFLFRVHNAQMALAETHLPMEGGFNVRDLGGMKTKNGQYVKWGALFRSDDLGTLTDNDLAYLSSAGIKTIIDFRSEEEIADSADRIPSSVEQSVALSISPGNLQGIDDLADYEERDLAAFMEEMNRLLASDEAIIAQYRTFFELLQTDERAPVLYHCTAGKDRTGMATALILYALGVDEDTIMNDYLLSNNYLGDKYAKYIARMPALRAIFEVRASYLQAGIDRIKRDHGSVERYLTNVLRVNLKTMRAKYLY